MVKKVERLFKQFQPENYELELESDRETLAFSGRVIIRGKKIGPPSQRITLHQKDLKIKNAKIFKLDKKNETEVKIDRINTQRSFDELRLHTKEKIFSGEYRTEIEFTGKITDQMHGIYPCYYNSRKKTLIATQFESHHAREVFPSIDEPEAKATFDLTITVPTSETVLSNTPIKKEVKRKDKKDVTFETSPKMSTYLLAFVHGELVCKEAKTKKGVVVRSYATPENKGLLDLSVDVAAKCVDFFEDYFGVDYPLSKMDLVALPDFSVGAMENWGLITFRDSVMLADQKHTSIETKQLIALVVAHEVSHQWFGNLVTMKWWDDLWLNESFANLMEYRAVDEIFPEWKIWEQFINHELAIALRRDALPNVQAVRTPVKHPDELDSLFDPAIAYAKGGSVLNMLRHLIGEADFRKGLKTYFEKHKYGSTEAADLWKAFSEVSHIDVGIFMEHWLNKPGYPEVKVNYNPESEIVILSQQRLIISSKAKQVDEKWSVPLAAHPEFERKVFDKKTEELKIPKKQEPPILNHDGQSYFVPNYTNVAHFELILKVLKQGELNTIDRLLLLQQTSLLEQARRTSTVSTLKLIESYSNERDEAVWDAISAVANGARRLVAGDQKAENDIKLFMRMLVSDLLSKTGWQSKPEDSAKALRLRATALSIGAASEIPEVIKEAKTRFAKFTKPSDLTPETRDAVYFVAAKFGSDKDFNRLIEAYLKTENSDERGEIAAGITSTKNPKQIAELLSLVKTDKVRANVVISWYVFLLGNFYARQQTWMWLKDNWNWIENKFGSEKTYDSFPRYTANVFSTDDELREFKKFFEPKKKEIALERAINIGIDEIEARVAWRNINEKPVKNWLSKNYSSSTKSPTK